MNSIFLKDLTLNKVQSFVEMFNLIGTPIWFDVYLKKKKSTKKVLHFISWIVIKTLVLSLLTKLLNYKNLHFLTLGFIAVELHHN